MKILQIIILVVVLGWFFSLRQATGGDPEETSIIAPNVFTPNGDGINDVFEVSSKEGKVVSLKIYNRAGVLVFSIEAKRCRWDGNSLTGQPLATGVYFYCAEVKGSDPKDSKSGFFHLYR